MAEDDDNYESDFEDDFEEDISEDEASEVINTSSKRPKTAEIINTRNQEEIKTIENVPKSIDLPPKVHNSENALKPRGFINFSNSKSSTVKKEATVKLKKRSQQLLALISLDTVNVELCNIPAIKYEDFIKVFGRLNMQQVSVQTNEDDVSDETQTDAIETADKWCQSFVGSGGDNDGEEDPVVWKSSVVDLDVLNWTIQKAGQVMCILLEEERGSGLEASRLFTAPPAAVKDLADGYIQLGVVHELKGLPITAVRFSRISSYLLVAIHDSPAESVNGHTSKGFLTLWDIRQPRIPKKILAVSSYPQCCEFSEDNEDIVFAGMVDGSVALWDIQDSVGATVSLSNETSQLAKPPTYSTAGVLGDSGHQSPVVAMQACQSDRNDDNMCIQLLTLDEYSVVKMWAVTQVLDPWDPVNLQTDLGLTPGGRVRLTLITTLDHISLNMVGEIPTNFMRTFCLESSPSQPGHFSVGTDSGIVLHSTCHGARTAPKIYKPDLEISSDVLSLAYSPFLLPCFLAGCSDGSIRLHNIRSGLPSIVWPHATDGNKVLSIQWSPTRPSVFFVLDKTSRLSVWDLSHSDLFPSTAVKLTEGAVLCMSISKPQSQSNDRPMLAVGRSDGTIDIYRLLQKLCECGPHDFQLFSHYLHII